MEKTQPKKDATLSEAILIGSKIARENGIKQITSTIFEYDFAIENNPKLSCACTAGIALIGKYGVEELTKRRKTGRLNALNLFNFSFEPKKQVFKDKRECLTKTLDKSFDQQTASYADTIYNFIWRLNDNALLKARYIAKKLEKCGL